MDRGLYDEKYPLFMSDFDERLLFSKDLETYSNTKFSENASNGSQVVPCGMTGHT
jgi:hypothetical protein